MCHPWRCCCWVIEESVKIVEEWLMKCGKFFVPEVCDFVMSGGGPIGGGAEGREQFVRGKLGPCWGGDVCRVFFLKI